MADMNTISPVDGSLYVERPLASAEQLEEILARSAGAQDAWARTPLAERCEAVSRLLDEIASKRDELAMELTRQMGRPIRYSAGELKGFEERGRAMQPSAADALAPIE